MKLLLTTVTFIFLALFLNGQNHYYVFDLEKKKPVPYVNIWVANQNTGTSTNKDGKYSIDQGADTNILVFSAIGYKTKRVEVEDLKDTTFLKQETIELRNVEVKAPKNEIDTTLNSYKKWKIRNFFGASGDNPWIIARKFKYDDTFKRTPFIMSINVVTKSRVKNASFNIRFYSVSALGAPDEYLLDENIIVQTKKGKKYTEVDLSDFNIRFPKDGFFIAFEWIVNEDNINEYTYTIAGEKGKHKGSRINPSFGYVPSHNKNETWVYSRGIWLPAGSDRNMIWVKDSDGKYRSIAISLTLMN